MSIRKFLLINLLLTIIITTAVTLAGNYFLDRHDIRSHLDILLSQASISFDALLGQDFHQRDLLKLQRSIDTIPEQTKTSLKGTSQAKHYSAHEKYQFQVWSGKGDLLLSTAKAPKQRLATTKLGFGEYKLNNTRWRTFTHYDKLNDIYIIAAEKVNEREKLANRIAIDDIYIMIITYPIAGILIWLIVGFGLRSIRRVTHEVSHRVPSYLEPVEVYSAPTEIKPLVIELNKLFLRLQQAFDREKRFAGDAAHELRTPLAALKTQAQVALKAKNDNERKQQLRNVIRGVDRCTHVVQQLLTLSRLVPESNTLKDTAKVDLKKLTGEYVAQLAPLAIEKNIDIELQAKHKDCYIQGNLTALGILIRNLVDNAIRYTPEDGKIIVSVQTDDELVTLKVTDNGPGIPPELRSRVFERFYRVLGNKSPGSGLGLAIVQQIAQLHDAQLKLGTSPQGQGLEVGITFNKIDFNG